MHCKIILVCKHPVLTEIVLPFTTLSIVSALSIFRHENKSQTIATTIFTAALVTLSNIATISTSYAHGSFLPEQKKG